MDASIFFPPPNYERKAERLAREAKAKAVCADCDVQRECLDWALTVGEGLGVWGGLSEFERKRLLEEREDPGEDEERKAG